MSNFRFSPLRSPARLLLPAFLFSSFAQAADIASLPAVVVTAARIEQLQTDALPHTTLLTSQDIRDSLAPDLPSLLQREAGIQLSQLGGPGQPVSMFIRGQSPNHSLILIDGVPFGQQGFTSAPALENLSLAQIESIEIVRGNASAIYGSGAIGGVIQIFTKKGNGEPLTNVSTEVGSFGTRSLNVGQSGSSGTLRYSLSLGTARSDGISANSNKQYPNENPDRDGFSNNSASAFLANEWSKGQELGLSIYANDANYRFDGGGSGDPTDIAKGSNQQESLSVFSKNRINTQWNSLLTLSHTELVIQSQTNNINFPYDFRDKSRSTQLQWQNEIALSGMLTLVAGGSVARQELKSTSADLGFGGSSASFSRNTSSVFTGLNAKNGLHQWQVNVRHDVVGGSGSDNTAYLGYGYQLTPTLKLIASASTAFNAPTLAQLFDASSGNPNLKAEKATSFEVGSQYSQGGSLLRFVMFYTKTRNQFAPNPDLSCTDSTCKTINLLSSHNKGAEISLSKKMGDTTVRTSLTVQDPINDSTGETLFRRSKYFGSVAASHVMGKWNFGADMIFSGSHGDKFYFNSPPYSEDRTVSGFGKANLTVRNQISKNLAAYARIENIFNREYQTVYGYNQLPRAVYVGLNWQH
jgi:vitamin B12 transporter